jgi:flavorubredoxin/flavin reductase (DIM6/NTAB) family NADH-FMN oxidoreductase RutF
LGAFAFCGTCLTALPRAPKDEPLALVPTPHTRAHNPPPPRPTQRPKTTHKNNKNNSLERGTTYNAYLIFGATHTALVDASHEKFGTLFPQALRAALEAAGRTKIDYIICSHTEPDHSFLVPAVLQDHPDATVVGSKVCLTFLRGLIPPEAGAKMKERAVKGGDVIDLGGGHELEFVLAPNLHWPDTMFSFDRATGVMYTCDAFGAHYCARSPFDSDVPALLPHFRFYYDCLMRPNAKSVTTALRKVAGLEYHTIATGHGPILRYSTEQLVGYYQDWSEKALKGGAPSVAVLYSADYGFSDRLSQTLARGVTKAGEVTTDMLDALSADPQDVVGAASRAKAVVLMAPPSGDAGAKQTLSALASAIKPGTKVLVAESFGGRDEPVDVLLQALVAAGAEPVATSVAGGAASSGAESDGGSAQGASNRQGTLRVRDAPTQATYQAFEEAGARLSQALTSKDRAQAVKDHMPPEVAKALGRLSSGLYVVTAEQQQTAAPGGSGAESGARGAMVASWVSQASFEPLGLTVAVAKDRAMESLLQVGDRFVLNVLGEDDYAAPMKHFLRRFAPGEDRFAGVETFRAGNGCPALSQAIAFAECKVVSRLETPDHWVTYAEVTGGDVLRSEVKTAVHRRLVGNYY